MNKSEELFGRAKAVIPGGVHSPVRAFKSVGGTPVFFRSANGAYLESVDGKRYIDMCQGFGPNILGHRDPNVQNELENAVKDAWNLGTCDPYSLELAEWINSRVFSIDKIRLVCSGTEAVMSALRIARAATGRNKILKFNGCYHGHADPMLVKAGSGLAGTASSDSAGVSEQVSSDTLVAELNDEDHLDEVFRQHGPDIAAVVLEPLPANYGLLIQRMDWLHRVCDVARRNKSLVIFDEVISGFRIGIGGMAEKMKTKPDLVTYGKIIGGGFPVGAYAGAAHLMDMVAPEGPVYQAGTLAANPISVRAGLATLRKIESANVIDIINQRTTQFADNLNNRFLKSDIAWSVAHMGSLFWLHPNIGLPMRSPNNFTSNQKVLYAHIFHEALKRQVYLPPSAFEVGFVSFAHKEDILNQVEDVLFEAVQVTSKKESKK